ncbi:MAG: M23 family metallopeptidase [Bacteroidales bacterium]|nr:M23 family metallopeptidase [Bacteroidales bacterium]
MVNMFGRKYFLDPETLRFEQVRLSSLQRLRYSVFFVLGLIALAVILRYGFERYYPTPRQIIYERNNEILHSDYVALNTKLQDVESQLAEFRNRDDRFYRAILSLEPVPASIREAGTGGSETHTHLRNLREPGLVRNVSRKMDKISNKVQIQSRSLEDVYQEAITNQQFLACKPSINPISSADPFWLTSTYGFRSDPFTHRRTAHHGIDLAGPYGLDIHTTGDGTVISAYYNRHGYGKEVLVDHGFGYITRYAHLEEILVKPGQKLKRGEVLGTLGSSGRSTGPHLHYEVRKNHRTVNPMYFFYENLDPREYTLLASRAIELDTPYQPNAMSQK